ETASCCLYKTCCCCCCCLLFFSVCHSPHSTPCPTSLLIDVACLPSFPPTNQRLRPVASRRSLISLWEEPGSCTFPVSIMLLNQSH
ncbi:hypothetical protein L9F63_014104, partial [Diploptera punctata]